VNDTHAPAATGLTRRTQPCGDTSIHRHTWWNNRDQSHFSIGLSVCVLPMPLLCRYPNGGPARCNGHVHTRCLLGSARHMITLLHACDLSLLLSESGSCGLSGHRFRLSRSIILFAANMKSEIRICLLSQLTGNCFGLLVVDL
jgi:hypothetical protein